MFRCTLRRKAEYREAQGVCRRSQGCRAAIFDINLHKNLAVSFRCNGCSMNINAIQQSYRMAQTTGAVKNTDRGNNLSIASSSTDATENVSLSTKGKLLAEKPLLSPTRENVQKLSSALYEDLKELFDQAGINSNPPVEFDVDSYTGKVSVKGNRPDAQQIAEMIKKNPDIEMQIHNIAAISSHIGPMEKAMQANDAYRAAKTQAELNNVIAKYSSVYSGKLDATDFSLVFNGDDVQIQANGTPWISSRT